MVTETRAANYEGTLALREELARKFNYHDVETGPLFLWNTGEAYARSYEGTFAYMIDMRDAIDYYGTLTARQVAGTLNCFIAGELRKQRELTPAQPTIASSQLPKPGIYTIAFEGEGHCTFRVREGSGNWAGKLILSLLVGPDNTTDYEGLGVIEDTGFHVWNSRRHLYMDRVQAAIATLLNADDEKRADFGLAYAMASNRCCRCGRMLTVPASIFAGMGPECSGKVY